LPSPLFIIEINVFYKVKKTLNNVIFVNSCKKDLFPGTVVRITEKANHFNAFYQLKKTGQKFWQIWKFWSGTLVKIII
jgi:hypothetical protein